MIEYDSEDEDTPRQKKDEIYGFYKAIDVRDFDSYIKCAVIRPFEDEKSLLKFKPRRQLTWQAGFFIWENKDMT
jgi:hypothetical protein